ncbi:EscE/YscE/SsaE family type III secretion system needle protein co-chaperone [Spartinivicinus ruber]|uniref:EscE/YscE/SsaE family type III secretion system needle protein co-chaperone n=1 Tax=Spartinivicinus ruber TaxID=2683272 RepID=UPI0013D4B089|nr:EscE/YscE/SsaE family type III secretion system needle protein co-chaperone [Spartinivicinus ruber]
MQTEFSLTDLDDLLLSEQSEVVASQLLALLAEEQLHVNASIAQGVDPQTFQLQQQYLQALQAAEQVVNKLRTNNRPELSEVSNGLQF